MLFQIQIPTDRTEDLVSIIVNPYEGDPDIYVSYDKANAIDYKKANLVCDAIGFDICVVNNPKK